MTKVLLVEDSESCHLLVTRALASDAINLDWVKSIGEAKNFLTERTAIDLILLDLLLPDGDGISLLHDLRDSESFRFVPIMLLTGKEDLATKIAAFDLSADDYLVKPIDPRELRARVKMRIRKCQQQNHASEILKRGDLRIDLRLMRVYAGDSQIPIELTAKEFKILTILAQRENVIFSRTELIKAVWGSQTHVIERTVDSHVCGVRKKLGEHSYHIENVPGLGYRFRPLINSPSDGNLNCLSN